MYDGWLHTPDENDALAEAHPYSVTEFVATCNNLLEYSLGEVVIEGEVSGFKINQKRWVFFDLKEADTTVNCFMVVGQLTAPITDGMKVRVRATPKLTRWGRFSLTVNRIMPVGEGDIKKSFELLKKKLTAEGLFDPARKRPLPEHITRIGVISSTGAAGYIDFLKILDNRWGGLEIKTVNTQVQGLDAPSQIVRALEYLNQRSDIDIIAILRGGGSADDLAAFNDEALVRAIAASKLPVITGIGHEIDESLADLAADVRASTPSNAAERLTPDKTALCLHLHSQIADTKRFLINTITTASEHNRDQLLRAREIITAQIEQASRHVLETQKILEGLSPEGVLRRGYAIITGKQSSGSEITITTKTSILTAEVKNVQNR